MMSHNVYFTTRYRQTNMINDTPAVGDYYLLMVYGRQ